MNKLLWIIIIVVLAVGLYIYFGSKEEVILPADNFVSAEGVVTGVDFEGVALDGPALITIETSGEETRIIAVPSMGILLCEAYENMADAFSIKVGDQVSVKGELDEESKIVPCSDASHYMRVIEPEVSGGVTE